MGALMRAHDWASTPVGPPDSWPQSLRVAVRLLLTSSHPMFIWWGPDLIQFYNDAYRRYLGPEKHPAALGAPGRETWAEIWDVIGLQIEHVLSGGGATWHENHHVPITRHGRREDVWWTYGYSPIDDETASAGVGGVLVVCHETTEQVLAARRHAYLLELSDCLRTLHAPRDIMSAANRLLGEHLGVGRVAFAEVDLAERSAVVACDWCAGGLDSYAGRHPLKALAPAHRAILEAGEPLVVTDVENDPLAVDPAGRARLLRRSVRALINVPVRRRGELVAILAVHAPDVRQWSDWDVRMAEETAGRVWTMVERARVSEELARSNKMLRMALDAGEMGVWRIDFGRRRTEVDDRLRALLGLDPGKDDYPFEEVEARIHPADLPRLRDELAAIGPTGIQHTEFGVRDAEGVERWLFGAGKPLDAANPDHHEVIGVNFDMTDRVNAAAALRESRTRLRLAQEVSGVGTFQWNVRTDVNEWSPEIERLHGLEPGTFGGTYEDWARLVHPDDLPGAEAEIGKAFETGRLEAEWRVRRPDGETVWLLARAVVERDEAGEPLRLIGANFDITARVQAESHQRMLMAELDHRVKYVLSVVQSIARQSLWEVEPDAVERLGGRLSALARSHSLLADSRWEGAGLHSTVEQTMAPYRREQGAHIDVRGEDLRISPKAAQSLSLALHELVTNAAKYGALSVETGNLEIAWGVRDVDGAGVLELDWRETGGPAVTATPERTGFGSSLIHMMLADELGGALYLDYRRTGLVMSARLPLQKLMDGAPRLARPPQNERSLDGAGVRPPPSGALRGKRILVCDDERLVAEDVADTLRSAGVTVIGPLTSLQEAQRWVEADRFDAAVLDINLDGELVWPVAKTLRDRGIPFLLASGYSDTLATPEELADAPRIDKPLSGPRLLARLALILDGG